MTADLIGWSTLAPAFVTTLLAKAASIKSSNRSVERSAASSSSYIAE